MVLDLSKFNNQIGMGVSTPTASAPESEVYKTVAAIGGELENKFRQAYDASVDAERTATVVKAKFETESKIQKEYTERLKFVNSKGNVFSLGADGEEIDSGESFDNYMAKFTDSAVNDAVTSFPNSATKQMFHNTFDSTSFQYKTQAFVDKNKKISDFADQNFKTLNEVSSIEVMKSNPHDLVNNSLKGMEAIKTQAEVIRSSKGQVYYEAALRDSRNNMAKATAQTLINHASTVEGLTAPASAFFGLKFQFRDFNDYKKYAQEMNPDLKDSPEFQETLVKTWNEPVDAQNVKLYQEVGKHLSADQYRQYLNQYLGIKFKKQEAAKADVYNEWKALKGSAGLQANYSNWQGLQGEVSRVVSISKSNGWSNEKVADHLFEVGVNSELQDAIRQGVMVSREGFKGYYNKAIAKSRALVASHLGEEGTKILDERKITGGAALENAFNRFQKEKRMYAQKMNNDPLGTSLATNDTLKSNVEVVSRGLLDESVSIKTIENAYANAKTEMAKATATQGVHRADINVIPKNVVDNFAYALNTGNADKFLGRVRRLPPKMKSEILTQLVSTGKLNLDQAHLFVNEAVGSDPRMNDKINNILREAYSPKTKAEFYDLSRVALGVTEENKKIHMNTIKDAINKGMLKDMGKLGGEAGLPMTSEISRYHANNMFAIALNFYKNEAQGNAGVAVEMAEKLYFKDRINPQNRTYIKANIPYKYNNEQVVYVDRFSRAMVYTLKDAIKTGKVTPSLNTLPLAEREKFQKQYPQGEAHPDYKAKLSEKVLRYMDNVSFTADSFDGDAETLYLRNNSGPSGNVNIILKNKNGQDETFNIELSKVVNGMGDTENDTSDVVSQMAEQELYFKWIRKNK